jgi:CDP-6-deoxy-D-xylo-4-hexulose-3-dehydrase
MILDARLRLFLDELLDKYEIESRPVLTGNFLRQPVMQMMKGMPAPEKFKVAEKISQNYFMVGCHQDLVDSQVDYLCSTLKLIAQELESLGQDTIRAEP